MGAADTDIINSATPLETRFEGVHPRLYLTREGIEALRGQLDREPWAGFLGRVRAVADSRLKSPPPKPDATGDLRGHGEALAHLVVAHGLTGERPYFDAARDLLAALIAFEDWTTSLQFGHWADGSALAYDWLYHELDEPLRLAARDALFQRADRVYRHWCAYADATATGYTWNHMAVLHGGLTAAGCALWGDLPGAGVGPILRMALEKARLMVDALGPDGASAEGLAYGQYHLEYLLKSMTLCERLLGLDLFEGCEFLRHYPRFMLHSSLPRGAWRPGVAFVILGDNDGRHWIGPDTHLRLVASRFGDPHARWLADELTRAGAAAESAPYLNLFWHAETAPAAQPPDGSPTLHHLRDKDIVFLRGGWDERASVFAIKCGPSSGHHAARRYRHNVSGGHMHPDAGHVVLHAGGEWLLIDDGYTFKRTASQNTALVNGVGQTGEGFTWFEDLEVRRGKAEGRILRADPGGPGGEMDYVIADAAPAYEVKARLSRFLRHVLYVKPDAWVLVDEFEAQADSVFELRFHAPQFFADAGEGQWAMRHGKAALRLTALGPTPHQVRPFVDKVPGTGDVHTARDIEALAIANAAPRRGAVFVTVLHAHAADAPPRIAASLAGEGRELSLTLASAKRTIRIALRPGQVNSAEPIYELGS